MSFIIPKKPGNFLNAKLVKDKKLEGKIAKITGRGEIKDFTSKEGKTKDMWNVPVEVEGMKLTYSPNSTNLDIWTEAWGKEKEVDGKMQMGVEQDDVVGRCFKISLVKVKFMGEMVDSIQTEPIKGKVVEGKEIENVKI